MHHSGSVRERRARYAIAAEYGSCQAKDTTAIYRVSGMGLDREWTNMRLMTISAVAIVLLSSVVYVTGAYAEPSISDVDALMKAHPGPMPDLSIGPAQSADICVRQTCHRLVVVSAPINGDPANGIIDVTVDNPNADFVCASNDCSFCPELDDFSLQGIGDVAHHWCSDRQPQGLGLPIGSAVYFHCSAVKMAELSETHCEGEGNGRPL
jgi:hypothetical protein